MTDEELIKLIREKYFSKGRRTIPIILVKDLIERLQYHHSRMSQYLDIVVDVVLKCKSKNPTPE